MKKYSLILFTLCFNFSSFAQKDSLHNNYKTYFGLGFSLGGGSEAGIFGDALFYLQRKNNYAQLKTSGIQEVDLFDDRPLPSISDISFTIGKSIPFNSGSMLQVGAGLGMVKKVTRGNRVISSGEKGCLICITSYEPVRSYRLGVPFELRYHFLLDQTASIYLGLSANINQSDSYAGLSLGVCIGQLRDRKRKP